MANTDKNEPTLESTVSQFIDAGIGLAMLPFSLAQKSFASSKEETSATLASLQARGEEIDAKLKAQFNPAAWCDQMFQWFSPKSHREAQIDQLSAKVDTLVELVATLAAKRAAEAEAKAKAKPAPKAKASAKTSAAKPAASDTATDAEAAPKKPATRTTAKRTTTAAKRRTTSTRASTKTSTPKGA